MSASSPQAAAAGAPASSSTDQLQVMLRRHVQRAGQLLKIQDLATYSFAWFGAIVATWIVACLVEHWVLPLPAALRWVVWLTAVSLSGWLCLRTMIPLLVRRINPDYVAQRIEKAEPELKTGLVSWLQLESMPDNGVPRGIMAGLARHAARHIHADDPSSSLDARTLIKTVSISMLLLAGLAVYGMLSPKSVWATGQRVLMPWSSVAAPARVQLVELSPGSGEVTQGKPLQIAVKLSGLRSGESVTVRYSTLDGQLRDQIKPLDSNIDGFEFSGSISTAQASGSSGRGMQHEIDYWIEAGDLKSGPYRITLGRTPVVTLENIVIQFPAYTKLAERKLANGEIEAVEGSRVLITASANQPLKRGQIEINPELDGSGNLVRTENTLRMDASDRQLIGRWLLELNNARDNPTVTRYRLRGFNSRDDANDDPIEYRARILADVGPEVTVPGPEDRLLRMLADSQANIEVRAIDPDFGLSRVSLEVKRNNMPLKELVLLESDGAVGRQVKKWRFKAADYHAKVGDRYTFVATAEDNHHDFAGQPAPHRAQSTPLTIEIVAPEELAKTDAAHQPPPNLEPADSEVKPGTDKPGTNQPPSAGEPGSSEKNSRSNSNDDQRDDKSQTPKNNGRSPKEPQRDPQQDSPQDSPDGQRTDDPKGDKSRDDKNSQKSGNEKSGNEKSGNEKSGNEKSGNEKGGNEKGGQQGQGNAGGSSSSSGDENSAGQSGQSGQSSSSKSSSKGSSSGKSGGSSGSQGQGSSNASNSSSSGSSTKGAGDASGKGSASNSAGSPDEGQGSNAASGQRSDNPSGSTGAGQRADGQSSGAQSGKSPSKPTHDGEAIERIRDYVNNLRGSNNSSQNSNSNPNKNPNQGGQQGPQQAGQQGSQQGGQQGSQQGGQQGSQQGGQQGSQQGGQQGSQQGGQQGSQQGGQQGSQQGGQQGSQQGGQQGGQQGSQQSGQQGSQQGGQQGSQQGGQQGSQQGGQQGSQQGGQQGSQQGGQQGSQQGGQQGSQQGGQQGSQQGGQQGSQQGGQQGSQQGGQQGSQQGGQQGSQQGGQLGSQQGGQQGSQQGAQQGSQQGAQQGSQQGGQQGSQQGGQQGSQQGGQQGSQQGGQQGSQQGGQQGSQQAGQQGSQQGGQQGSQQGGQQGSQQGGQQGSQQGGQQGSQTSQAGQPGTKQAGQSGGDGSGGLAGNHNDSGAGPRPAQPLNPDAVPSGQAQANEEYANKVTNLVLDYLKQQKDQPDPQLLRELNWSKADLDAFLKRWEAARDLSQSPNPADKRKWEDELRALGLVPTTGRGQISGNRDDKLNGLRDSGSRMRAPESLRRQFDAFRRAIQETEK